MTAVVERLSHPVNPVNPVQESSGVPSSASAAVTIRSVLIGALCVTVLCGAVPYNDYRLQNTFLFGNHLPIAGIFLLSLLTLGVNAFLFRYRPRSVLRVPELAVIWSMILVGGGLASSGLMRYMLPLPVAAVYYGASKPAWAGFLGNIPDWMLPTRDAASPVVLGFFEGLPAGGRIPWGAWVRPVAAWGVGYALLVVMMFSLGSLLRRHWTDNERLTFPLVQLPLEMMRAPEPGRVVNSFYRNPLTWTGFVLVALIHSMNGLHTYYASFPQLPLILDTSKAFPDRPWNALGITQLRIYFSIIGVTYLLATEVSFSIWFFFIALRLIRVLRASMGMDPVAPGFFSQESAWVVGAMLAWGASMLWVSLPYLLRAVRAAVTGSRGEEAGREVISYRAALVGIAVSFAGLLVWGRLAGIQPGYMALLTVTFMVMTIMVTRAVVEGGILMVQLPMIPHDALAPLMGTGWLKPASWTAGTVYQAVYMHDLREVQMPNLMHSFKLRDAAGRMPGWQLTGALAVALGVGFVVGTVAFLYNTYSYGAINLDSWGMRNAPNVFYGRGAQVLGTPLRADTPLLLNVAAGGVVGLAVALLRLRLVWFPLHPLGFVLANAWATSVIWFAIFAAWLLKTVVMRYGGLRLYRAALPLFLGMVLGEGFTAVVWAFIGAITGAGAVRFLPE
jgi:hypothetical protein